MPENERQPLDDDAVIRILKALADPTRFRIVRSLAENGEMSCGEIGAQFDVSQPTISHHMKVLRDAGLLVSRSEGKSCYTAVDAGLLATLATLLPAKLLPRPRNATKVPRAPARKSSPSQP